MSESIWNADLGNGMYKNPILYADYSDPDAIRVGDDYYMIASSFCNAPGLPVLHSKDLVNWQVINYVIDKVPESRYRNPIHGCGVWAPAIRYHDGIFYVCFPMPDEGIYMSTTTDPYGTWSEPVNIRPGAGWIDPCPFWDEDGKAYLVAGVAKSRIGYKSVLHMVEMQPDGMGLIGPEIKVFDGNENDQVTIEGPKLYKKDGYYYIFAPAGGVKPGWQTVLRSKNIYGPYEYRVVMRQGDSPINGPHQGAWVDTITGEDWFIHFQDVYAAGRIIDLEPMSWNDGWPIIGIAKNGNTYGEPVTEYKKPDIGNPAAIAKCEPATSDDFTGETLGLQWQWNANPEAEWYSIDKVNSRLILNAVSKPDERPLCDARNLLLQKWPAPEFSCVTKVDVSGMENGDVAGIISMGVRYGAIAVEKVEDDYQLLVINGKQVFDKDAAYATDTIIKADINATNTITTEIYFKYEVLSDGIREKAEYANAPKELVNLYYSFDNVNYMKALSMNAEAGRWVGVKNGVFVYHRGKGKCGFISVESVEYKALY